ncbi:hypothetical protein D9758_010418 [Tetrapyrgos nigripes]|uniref:Xylanolytic transcriptional activator regulatory domain-containing protein n=1 Tax=Tetrapyrgos nigripes TaxID=182062 RepID=A0A8H5CP52_9AGAR|nr:hypothetical protein D9758_010418 [Tetrapyrgos nigripes]
MAANYDKDHMPSPWSPAETSSSLPPRSSVTLPSPWSPIEQPSSSASPPSSSASPAPSSLTLSPYPSLSLSQLSPDLPFDDLPTPKLLSSPTTECECNELTTSCPSPCYSKREYLLAQIRQKDAIIESLLKQLHNPYIATPLSIASYRLATSPSDSGNKNVLAWLDRMQTSVQSQQAAVQDAVKGQASVQGAGGSGGPSAFTLMRQSIANAENKGIGIDGNKNREGEESDDEQQQSPEQSFSGSSPATTKASPANVAGDEDEATADDKLQTLPDSHVPLGLLANLALSNNNKARAAKKEGREREEILAEEENLDDDNVGVANETYFLPGPATDLDIRATIIEQHSPPDILVHGLVTPDDVDKLFDIYYNKCNPFISLLDPVLHTPASTFARCPFLFTVICAISSRYYAEKSEIYPIAMHFAKHSAATALTDGWKSVELCQAYILMSIYSVPARRWEEDRSWLYTGLAIRIATDLNLHHPPATKPQDERQEREMLNRMRVWMICFNLDRSTATQFGKPSTIKENFFIRNSKEWYKKSKYNLAHDVHLCSYSALMRILTCFHEEIFSDPNSPSGLNKKIDFKEVTLKHDRYLTEYHQEWTKRFKEELQHEDESSVFRCKLLPFYVAYSRLVMFSFGFQQAFQRGIQSQDNIFFSKCFEAAKAVVTEMLEGLVPTGYVKYAPDGHFVFSSFASAFLLKLLRPEFSHLLRREDENETFDLIGRVIQTLSSSQIAIDDRHTPKLYARFLAGLLSRHRRDGGAMVGRLQPQPPLQQQVSSSGSFPQSSSMSTFSVSNSQGSSQGQSQGSQLNFQHESYTQQSLGEKVTNSTPVYRPEMSFTAGAGPIQFDNDVTMLNGDGNLSGDDTLLAAMQAVNNPAWWQNMMMPGFSWPDPASPQSNKSSSPPPNSNYQNAPVSINPSYGMFHAQQPTLY